MIPPVALLAAVAALIAGFVASSAGQQSRAPASAASCARAWSVDLHPQGSPRVVTADERGAWVAGVGGRVLRIDGTRKSWTTIPGVDAVVNMASQGGAVWAVGARADKTGHATGDYVFRLSGQRWQRVRVRGLPAARRGLAFSGIDLHAGDVWLVGSYDNSDDVKVFGSGWLTARGDDAQRWRVASGRSSYAGLVAVAVVDDADAWAVGGQGPTIASAQEVMLHWNGSRWVDLSRYDYVMQLNDVVAFSRSDAWAVGATNLDSFARYADRPAVEHWDGKRWARVKVAWRWPVAPVLHAIAAFGPRDVWAGGRKFNESPALLHWDGTRWKEVAPPPVKSAIFDLAAGPDGTLWAVGEQFIARSRCK